MANTAQFYIDGEWVDPVVPRTADVIDPATEKPSTTLTMGSAADVDKAVAAAKRAFPEFSVTTREQRLTWLRRLPQILQNVENSLPMLAREVMSTLVEQFHQFEKRISQYDIKLRELAQQSEPSRRLLKIDSFGPMTATAIVASMGDPRVFKSVRNYAASLGLVPRQNSTGGKSRLGEITKQGDRYLRTLLVHGARAYRGLSTKSPMRWARQLEARRHVNIAAVALAAKHARIAWGMLVNDTEYCPVR